MHPEILRVIPLPNSLSGLHRDPYAKAWIRKLNSKKPDIKSVFIWKVVTADGRNSADDNQPQKSQTWCNKSFPVFTRNVICPVANWNTTKERELFLRKADYRCENAKLVSKPVNQKLWVFQERCDPLLWAHGRRSSWWKKIPWNVTPPASTSMKHQLLSWGTSCCSCTHRSCTPGISQLIVNCVHLSSNRRLQRFLTALFSMHLDEE